MMTRIQVQTRIQELRKEMIWAFPHQRGAIALTIQGYEEVLRRNRF